ncbi:MAG: hypothetical protein HQK95_04975 [Nitrospirae bacterium]|nr:hypothetical protein [Nitrospirota bacterium]
MSGLINEVLVDFSDEKLGCCETMGSGAYGEKGGKVLRNKKYLSFAN